MKATITILLLLLIPVFTNAQKVFMAFNGSGVPEELTLVDSNGVKIGYSNYYNNSGMLVMSLNYKNGVPNGQWTKYDDKTGKVRETFVYVNGKLNGEHLWYDGTGKVINSVVFKNGVRINFPQAENLWTLQSVAPHAEGYSVNAG